MARVYPFKREVVAKIFKNLKKKSDFILAKPNVLEEVGRNEDPNYYPYHHIIGHPIDNYITFKI